jgi:DNA-binding response OmpR family regulator
MSFALHTQDTAYTRRLSQLLESSGARCHCFASAEGVMHATHHGGFDVAVIDTRGHRSPEDNLLAWVRGRHATSTAIVLLTADTQPDNLVRAFDAGADDVETVPIAVEVLAARLRAVQRRVRRGQDDHQRIHLAGYTLDRSTGAVQDRGRAVELTPREFAMAWFLFSRPSTFLSRDAISMAVWGLHADIAEHTIEQHVYMLRKKLRLSQDRGVWVRAAYGRGYRLEAKPPTAWAPVAGSPHADALRMAAVVESAWSGSDPIG